MVSRLKEQIVKLISDVLNFNYTMWKFRDAKVIFAAEQRAERRQDKKRVEVKSFICLYLICRKCNAIEFWSFFDVHPRFDLNSVRTYLCV